MPRALRRSLPNYGKSVQADGCPERVDPKFVWWIVNYRRRSRPKVLTAIAEYAPTAEFHILRSPHDVERFLADLP